MKNISLKLKLIIGFLTVIGLNLINSIVAMTLVKGEVLKQSAAYLRNAQIILVVSSVLVVIIGIMIMASCLAAVGKPLSNMIQGAHQLALGNLDVEIAKNGNDELGNLADELNAAKKLHKYQEELLEKIAVGDLMVSVQPKGEDDRIGNILYSLVRDQNEMLSNIKHATGQISEGSYQVEGASRSLAEGSTEQASAIEQITASMDEIAESTNVNATKAKHVQELVSKIESDVYQGDKQMQHLVEAMENINRSSENISKIIKVIDDIAFQTNILALNAAVEAARAGVHGKGFAVVAEEVRSLAAKSASAAQETAEMIEDSISKTEQGSKLAQATSDALSGVIGAVHKIAESVGDVTEASNTQATSVTQINQAIAQVSQVVQTNAATSEECAAASEELASQSARLKQLLGSYKLNDGAASISLDGGYRK